MEKRHVVMDEIVALVFGFARATMVQGNCDVSEVAIRHILFAEILYVLWRG